MIEFTEDEIACLKKIIYKVRQDEILELYNRNLGCKEPVIRNVKAFIITITMFLSVILIGFNFNIITNGIGVAVFFSILWNVVYKVYSTKFFVVSCKRSKR
jgi:hypothetical protein